MKNLAFILAIVLISTSCLGKMKKDTYTDRTFNHIDFKEITFTLDKKTNDTLHIEGLLKHKTIIKGIPCHHKISFVKNWKLEYFTLADEHTVGEYIFPKDTDIGFDINKYDLQTHYLVVAGHDFVNTCKFISNQSINGLLCSATEEVIFTTNWNLRACILGDDDTIEGNMLRKGTLAVFAESGSFSTYCLYDPIIQGYQCSGTKYTSWIWMGGGGIRFYPNGKLKFFYAVDDIDVNGVICLASSTKGGIWLYENGKLKKCTLAKDQTINGVLYEKKFTLKFDENRNITESYKDKFF